jgi:hypothetical protein
MQERLENERTKRRHAESELQKTSTLLREAQCELEMKVQSVYLCMYVGFKKTSSPGNGGTK